MKSLRPATPSSRSKARRFDWNRSSKTTSSSFIFKDATSGKTTYPPGRFLDTDMPKGGEIELDFNKAYNPPCAFTAYATCPLPPKQNVLAAAIEAGEKNYGHHE